MTEKAVRVEHFCVHDRVWETCAGQNEKKLHGCSRPHGSRDLFESEVRVVTA